MGKVQYVKFNLERFLCHFKDFIKDFNPLCRAGSNTAPLDRIENVRVKSEETGALRIYRYKFLGVHE